jgi:hypothetical protein
MTTNASNTGSTLTLAETIASRIHELRRRKSRSKIAREAGFKSEETLERIASGELKLPIDHVLRLARALDVDARKMTLAALRQYFAQDIIDVVTDEDRRDAERAEVSAVVTALTVEIIGLKEDAEKSEAALGETQDRIFTMRQTMERLVNECRQLLDDTKVTTSKPS